MFSINDYIYRKMENLEVILGKTEDVDAGLDELMVTLVPIKDAVMSDTTHAFDRSALKAASEQRYRSHLI